MKEEKKIEDKIMEHSDTSSMILHFSIIIAALVICYILSNQTDQLDRIEQKQDKIIEQIQKSHE